MPSKGKRKTTMAKLGREAKLREKRLDKQARKVARKLAPADPARQETHGSVTAEPPEDPPVADLG